MFRHHCTWIAERKLSNIIVRWVCLRKKRRMLEHLCRWSMYELHTGIIWIEKNKKKPNQIWFSYFFINLSHYHSFWFNRMAIVNKASIARIPFYLWLKINVRVGARIFAWCLHSAVDPALFVHGDFDVKNKQGVMHF